MKDLSKLPVYPIYQFYFELSKVGKALFWVMFMLLLSSAWGVYWMAENPVRYAIEVNEITQNNEQEIVIEEVQANYREFSIPGTAFAQQTVFSAGPIRVNTGMIWIFFFFQILAWSVFLAAVTTIKNWWSYIFMGLFTLHFHFSDLAVALSPDNKWLLEIAMLLLFLVPAVLVQREIIRVNVLVRALYLLLLYGGIHFAIYSSHGLVALHEVSVASLPILTIVGTVFLFFIGKDISNLIFFIGTNGKTKSQRWRPGYIFGAIGFVTMLIFLVFQETVGYSLLPIKDFGIDPIHILLFASLITVATSQNMYLGLKQLFGDRDGMTLLILSVGVISLSAMMFHISLGEYLVLYLIKRHGITFIFLGTIFQAIYVALNFYPHLRNRINIYFFLMMPKRVMYVFVILFIAMISWGIESYDHQKSKRIFYAITYNRLGDHSFIQGDVSDALSNYRISVSAAEGGVKSNYNIASLMITAKGSADSILTHYAMAQKLLPFEYAAINNANLKAIDSPKEARNELLDHQKRESNGWVANNLALSYQKSNLPDSAILNFKEALILMPKASAIYTNLGYLYWENERYDEARKFYSAALNCEFIAPSAVSNALLMNQLRGDSLLIPSEVWKNEKIMAEGPVRLNHILHLLQQNLTDEAQILCAELLAENETPEALFIDAIIKFRKGDITNAISRLEYVISRFPSHVAAANHFLAVKYFEAGAPEMAASYFSKSAEAGWVLDHLNATRMEIDAGNHEFAMNQLNLVRVLYEELWTVVGHEWAMLMKAHGQDIPAYTEWDFEDITFNESVRISLYAGEKGNLIPALENFRRMIAEDSTTIIPYLEMGKIYLKYNDPLALENLEYGLTFAPGNSLLLTEIARAKFQLGEVGDAVKLVDDLLLENSSLDLQMLKTELQIANQDTAAAMESLLKLSAAHPLNSNLIKTISRVYRTQNMALDGYGFVYNAIQLNKRNSDLWYYLAVFAQQLGELSVKDAGYSAMKAIEFSYDENRKLEIAGEFAKEIRILTEAQN